MVPVLRNVHPILLLVCLGVVSGCSSTKLVDSWSDPKSVEKPLERILILGIMRDDMQRRVYEDVFVKRLSKSGVVGIAGYTVMPNRDDYDEKDEIKAAVKKTQVDAALIARLVAVEKEEQYVPPTYRHTPSLGYGYGLYDYYGMSYQMAYEPGYTVTNTIVRLETTVFATTTEKMIWAGATRSSNPSSTKSLVNSNADLIVADMKKSGLM